ncbi:hypothetical protein [Nostoc sp.]|uniref:hypothetical protein n=1 Tax=Nostoc sp. TaxID=1180 RepID=UPI002FF723AC
MTVILSLQNKKWDAPQELGERDDIKVIVLVKKKSSKKRDIVDELTENPVQVNGVFSREEIYNL